MGLVDPGLEYWEAQSTSLDEAIVKMKQHKAMRRKLD